MAGPFRRAATARPLTRAARPARPPRRAQSKNGQVTTDEALGDKKVVGLYFSAHWCPPCRGFTPVLATAYKELTAEGKNFEVVFISSDQDQAKFDAYYDEMPWLALPFSERDTKSAVQSEFGVSGIPMLVLLDESGNCYNKNGRQAVSSGGPKAFPWK